MKLIREEIESVQVITEESNGKKTFTLLDPFFRVTLKIGTVVSTKAVSLLRKSRDTTKSLSKKIVLWENWGTQMDRQSILIGFLTKSHH